MNESLVQPFAASVTFASSGSNMISEMTKLLVVLAEGTSRRKRQTHLKKFMVRKFSRGREADVYLLLVVVSAPGGTAFPPRSFSRDSKISKKV